MTVSTKPTTAWAHVNEQGDLVIPRDVAERYGLNPGAKVRLDESTNFVRMHRNINLAGQNWGGANDVCNFVEGGTMSIAWDGYAAPCWALMHTHTSFLKDKMLTNQLHIIGNIAERSLLDLWLDPAYLAYRERLHNFGFAPCTFCGGCDLTEGNQEDCFANPSPVCGVCDLLSKSWAQGVIQCP